VRHDPGWSRQTLLWALVSLMCAACTLLPRTSGGAASAHPLQSNTPPGSSAGTIAEATARAGGYQLSLRLAGGPYFLSELLTVWVSLGNHTGHALTLDGDTTPDRASPALDVRVSGGTSPTYALPFINSFPGPPPLPYLLPAGQSLSMTLLIPLTASGRLTIAARAAFPRAPHQEPDGAYSSVSTDPFTGHEPFVTITVSPRVPPDRVLLLKLRRGSKVTATPADTRQRPALLYQERLSCQWPTFLELSGTRYWSQLPVGGVTRYECDDKPATWSVMISAPGYAIAAVTYRRKN